MNQGLQTGDKVSLCHKDTCVHVEGSNARTLGGLLMVGAAFFMAGGIIKFFRQL